MEKKPLPIGVDDYEKLITNGYYYVDKTDFIKELLDRKGDVNLFTRPRRFGKTLNLSMLRCFFENSGEDKSALFEGKRIMAAGETYTRHMGKYPVISLSFKSSKQPAFSSAYFKIKEEIISEYDRHRNVLPALPEEKQRIYKKILSREADMDIFSGSLKFLSDCLCRYYGHKAIILIDEYDVPLENAYFSGFYHELTGFIRSLFESALKTNSFLEFAVITGCLRISKESIFTGLNNLNILSVLSPQYAGCFGFTEEETLTLLEFCDAADRIDEVRDWYNGYLFGKAVIYNPWSVMKFCYDLLADSKAPPLPYWANTSSNSIVRRLISRADLSVREELEKLLEGGCVNKPIHEDITYEDIDKSEDSLWNFLFFTGYLKKAEENISEDGTRYASLAIPNREVKLIYRNTVLEWLEKSMGSKNFSPLYHAILEGNPVTAEEIITNSLLETISMYDYAESFYHGFLAGLFKHMEGYILESNPEKGEGRPDLIIRTPSVRGIAIILELKVSKSFEGMEKKCREALQQIKEKRYAEGLEAEGYCSILAYGIAFYKKDCMVIMQS